MTYTILDVIPTKKNTTLVLLDQSTGQNLHVEGESASTLAHLRALFGELDQAIGRQVGLGFEKSLTTLHRVR